MCPMTCPDITKARRLLGYRPTTGITEGIPRFVESYLATQRNPRGGGATRYSARGLA